MILIFVLLVLLQSLCHASAFCTLAFHYSARGDSAFVLITEKVSLTAVKEVAAELEGFDWCRGQAYVMPVLREDWVSAMAP